MNPSLVEGYTDIIGPPKDWNEDTMGVCFHLPIKFYVEDDKPYIESEWEATAEEAQAIVEQLERGERPRVRFRVMGTSHPVVSLWVP